MGRPRKADASKPCNGEEVKKEENPSSELTVVRHSVVAMSMRSKLREHLYHVGPNEIHSCLRPLPTPRTLTIVAVHVPIRVTSHET